MRRQDGLKLLMIYKRVTGLGPKMWGPSIVGFGVCRINGSDWPKAAFSPRKQSLTLYAYPKDFPGLLKDLGKYTTGVACLYINKLDDINLNVLVNIIAASFKRDKEKYDFCYSECK